MDRLSGKHKHIRKRNDREAIAVMLRDPAEKDALIFRQLEQRRRIPQERKQERSKIIEQKQALHKERRALQEMSQPQHSPEAKQRA